VVDELGYTNVTELGIGKDDPFFWLSLSHFLLHSCSFKSAWLSFALFFNAHRCGAFTQPNVQSNKTEN
jgi:hypothetical protein